MIEKMAKALKASNVLHWLCRRYFRFIFLGAMTTCIFFNLALHTGSGLILYCQEECLEMFLMKPLSALDRDVVHYIEDNYIDPPFPKGSYEPDFDINDPPWGKLGKWNEALNFVQKYFKGYTDSGFFVEIGAQDGEFMSLSLWLEQVKNFKGVLIEPNPVDYEKLRAMKRSSKSIQACASPSSIHTKDFLWLRDIPDHLPPLLKRIQEGSNRLLKYVALEDRELGKEIKVQCFNVGAIIFAALKTRMIDFLTISTHGGELDVLSSIPLSIKIRCLVVVAPVGSESEINDLNTMATDRNLKEVHSKGNIHIFILAAEVQVVKV